MKERTILLHKTIVKEKMFEDINFETHKEQDIKYERIRNENKEAFFIGEVNTENEDMFTNVNIIDTSIRGKFTNVPLFNNNYNLQINLNDFNLPDGLKIDQIKISEKNIQLDYELNKDNIKEIEVKSCIKSYSISLSLVYNDQTVDEYIVINEKNLPYINYEINQLLINLVKKQNMTKIHAGKYKCFFNAQCTSTMLNIFCELICGQEIINKSIYSNMIGKKVMHESISIIEDRFSIVDFDGNLSLYKFIVKNGILQTYLLNRKNAAKVGLNPTGNAGMSAEIIGNIEASGDKMYEKHDLEIIELLGIDYNENTGHFNAVVTGFLNDKPVNGGIINFNLKDFFLNMRLCHDGLFIVCDIAS
jgi:hypothetical protein